MIALELLFIMFFTAYIQGSGVGTNTAHYVIGIVVFGLQILNVGETVKCNLVNDYNDYCSFSL